MRYALLYSHFTDTLENRLRYISLAVFVTGRTGAQTRSSRCFLLLSFKYKTQYRNAVNGAATYCGRDVYILSRVNYEYVLRLN